MPEIGELRKKGGLLKTGQTTQYGGYKDDGYYKKGLSKKYSILTAGQYAGTTDITLNAKTDVHSNNCVYDRRTKLMWSRYQSASVGQSSNGLLPFTTNGSGEGIFAYADAANAAKLAGHDDWRVPNIHELHSLTHSQGLSAAPDETAFPGWDTANNFHSSTTCPTNTNAVLAPTFGTGAINVGLKTQEFYLTLVRGG